MAWIELHQSLIKHPKTTKAAELAGMDRHKFIGHLVCFWLWALEYADVNGVLPGNVTPAMIASTAGVAETYNRRSKIMEEKFVQALLNCGADNQAGFLEFLDGHYQIHDWRDFAGRLLEKRIANKERMYNARATHKPNTNNARAGATVPNPTKPTIITNVIIPAWINKEVWDAYLEMRKKIKKVPTDYAIQLVFKDLERFKAEYGDDPNEVLNKSITSNWPGVFPLKKDASNLLSNKKGGENGQQKKDTIAGPPPGIPGLTIEDFGK